MGLVVLTSDTGLCGTYNEHVLEVAERFLTENPSAPVVTVGKKGSRFFTRRGVRRMTPPPDLSAEGGSTGAPAGHKSGGGVDWGGRYDPQRAGELLDWLVERYRQGEVSGWAVAYMEFVSALRWRPAVAPLVPLAPVPGTGTVPGTEGEGKGEGYLERLIVEPDVPRFADALLQRALQARFTRLLLEAFTAEHSARMIAMKNATENAAEMIDHLTLVRNKARQAAITKELIEVVSGAEALK